jgi:hypothetical protein
MSNLSSLITELSNLKYLKLAGVLKSLDEERQCREKARGPEKLTEVTEDGPNMLHSSAQLLQPINKSREYITRMQIRREGNGELDISSCARISQDIIAKKKKRELIEIQCPVQIT